MTTMKQTHSSEMDKPQPLIPTKVVVTTFVTFVVFTLVFFHYDAYSNGLTTSQVNVGNMLVTLLAPVAISLISAPVMGLARHSTFIAEFKPILCITALAGIFYIMYLLFTGRGFGF